MQQRSETLTNIISEPMRRYMNRIPAAARFLLLLKPGTTKLAFIPANDARDLPEPIITAALAAMDKMFDEKLAEIRQQGAKAIRDLNNARALFDLCHDLVVKAQRAHPNLHLDGRLIGVVAGRWLQQRPLSLGDVPKTSGTNEKRWRIEPANASQLRFQDMLDWRAEYGSSLAVAKQKDSSRFSGYQEIGVIGRPTIIVAPHSVDRENLVRLSNLKIFFAEHLLAYAGVSGATSLLAISPFAKEPGMSFFFQTMKGLGQYRAAIDWVAVDYGGVPSHRTEAELTIQASRYQGAALESLFTLSLLNAFSHSLRREVANLQGGIDQAVDNIRRVFADLWWAAEVRFYRHGHLAQRLIRGEKEEDNDWKVAAGEPEPWEPNWQFYDSKYPGFFATSGEGHPSLTYIRFDLSALIKAGAGEHPMVSAGVVSERSIYNALNIWSFDEVVFACYFFRVLKDDFAEWVDRLGEIILDGILEQAVLPYRSGLGDSSGLQDAAHWLNSLVNVADGTETAKRVEKVIGGMESQHHRDDLLIVRNRLQLLLLLEAGVGLMRLMGILANQEYKKLSVWFTRTSLAEWKQPGAFEKYSSSVTHFARAIASAFGRPSINVSVNSEETLYTDACLLDLNELRFPPLSKQEREHEPILAMLPALTEPLTNALRYLEKWPDDTSPIELMIEDRRKDRLPHILVKIGNRLFEKEERMSPSGLAKARNLMNIVKLASIDENLEFEDRGDASYFWVSVRLHPQLLYEEISQHS